MHCHFVRVPNSSNVEIKWRLQDFSLQLVGNGRKFRFKSNSKAEGLDECDNIHGRVDPPLLVEGETTWLIKCEILCSKFCGARRPISNKKLIGMYFELCHLTMSIFIERINVYLNQILTNWFNELMITIYSDYCGKNTI